MAYLMTKKQFDNLNVFEQRDVKDRIGGIHKDFIWVSITLKNPPKGLEMSRVKGALFSSSHNMTDYVRMNNKIAKQSVEITKIKSWIAGI